MWRAPAIGRLTATAWQITLLLLAVLQGFGQDSLVPPASSPGDSLVVNRIILTGNRITRPRIILRELTFCEGSRMTAPALTDAMKRSRENVFNLKLFNIVTVDTLPHQGTKQVDVNVSVIERWYIWPVPILELSERNFTVWWETRNLSKLTYGIDFTFFNVRGRNETLKILARLGYNQQYGFSYSTPYLNRLQTIGLAFGAGVDLNHEVSVETRDNKPVYLKDSSAYLKKIVYGYAELRLRPSYYASHIIRVTYNYYFFRDGVTGIGGFSLSDKSRQQFVSLSYFFRNDHRDAAFYPLKGYYMDVELSHSMPYATAHNSYLKGNLRRYWQIRRKWYAGAGITGKMSFNGAQPYYLQRGLGYGRETVRGYEYYVADGQHYILLKSNLKFSLLPEKVVKIGFINTTKFNTVPLALYLTAFADAGYVYNIRHNQTEYRLKGNTLENTVLAGMGMGLDFTTYYDIVIRIEGALNRLGQTGLFINFIAPI